MTFSHLLSVAVSLQPDEQSNVKTNLKISVLSNVMWIRRNNRYSSWVRVTAACISQTNWQRSSFLLQENQKSGNLCSSGCSPLGDLWSFHAFSFGTPCIHIIINVNQISPPEMHLIINYGWVHPSLIVRRRCKYFHNKCHFPYRQKLKVSTIKTETRWRWSIIPSFSWLPSVFIKKMI